MWTDSTIVLHWLASQSSKWSTFVSTRVALIQELSKGINWYKIDSKQSPADITSRRMLASQLLKTPLWRNGPDFLKESELKWPSQHLSVCEPKPPEYEKRVTNFVRLYRSCIIMQIWQVSEDSKSFCVYFSRG